MSSQRQLLGPPRLFGRLEFLGHIQWDINDVHMMKKWNWKSIFRYLVKGSVQWYESRFLRTYFSQKTSRNVTTNEIDI